MSLILLLFLLAFATKLHGVKGQSPPGFISLDCGLRDSNGYNDSITGLYYSTDEAYIDRGEGKTISPEFQTKTLPPQFINVRSFPGPEGTRNCYTLKPLYGKNNKILLRVAFIYGNYDDLNKVPQFDLYLGVDYWETVTLKGSLSPYVAEIIHTPTSNYVHVCLVNTGLGTPFISVLELRSMNPLQPVYNTTSGSLKFFARWDLGSTSTYFVRYKDGDIYDRMWRPVTLPNSTIVSNPSATSFGQNYFNSPPIIMSTAVQGATTNDSLVISFVPNNPSDQVYVYMHFAELVANQYRAVNVYYNGFHWYGPFVVPYLKVYSVMSMGPGSFSSYEFTINSTSNSTAPPIINAFEVYTVKQFPHYQTAENDVAAIISIKATYAITRNWQGDPCSPIDFAWFGINCSYNGFESPKIVSLNLSSSGLIGTISPSISNLTMLQSLDLSYNNLSGQVPDFLSRLPSLRYLYLNGNSFTGPLPPDLLQKSRNGSLFLSVDNSSNQTIHCVNDACKRKKNTVILPIVAPIAAFVVIFTFSILLWFWLISRRKRQVVQRVMMESNENLMVELNENVMVESNENDDSSIEPKIKQFKFSEIMSFIGENIRTPLGEGGFGTVYRGCMDRVEVAIKILRESRQQRIKDFQSEVKILATLYHKNVTKVLGYCNEGPNKAIIFELVENGNLKNHLSDINSSLCWERRLKILIDAGEGLAYMHHGCRPPVVHRDIKPENILLTKEFEAKLADFGLSRIFPVQTSRVFGTSGYVDPEYIELGIVTEKIDIYSFGVVMLVVLTGQPAIIQGKNITEWINPMIETRDIQGIIDTRLNGNFNVDMAWRVIEMAMKCVSRDSSSRPKMNHVMKELRECFPTFASAQYVSN